MWADLCASNKRLNDYASKLDAERNQFQERMDAMHKMYLDADACRRQLTEQIEDLGRSGAQELSAAACNLEAAFSRARLVEKRNAYLQQETDKLKGKLGEERAKLAQVVSEKGSLQTQSRIDFKA